MKSELHKSRFVRSYFNNEILASVVGLFNRFPILTNEAIFRIVMFLFMLPLMLLLHRWKGECTCEDQIQDKKLASPNYIQNSQVQAYLKTRDNVMMCEARRQALIRNLENNQHKE